MKQKIKITRLKLEHSDSIQGRLFIGHGDLNSGGKLTRIPEFIELEVEIPEKEKVKTKLMAPALCRYTNCEPWWLTHILYSSYEEAKNSRSITDVEIIWPAIPNAQGLYEVPEEK